MTLRRRHIAVILAAGAMIFASAGCVSPPSPPVKAKPMVTPAAARAEITDLFQITQEAIGGHWAEDTSTWQECATASGRTGASYHLLAQRLDQRLPGSDAATIAQITTLWSEHGVDASVWVDRSLTPPHHFLSWPAFGSGTGPDGYLVRFSVAGDDYASFSASSRCADGDAHELDLAESAPTPGRPADAR